MLKYPHLIDLKSLDKRIEDTKSGLQGQMKLVGCVLCAFAEFEGKCINKRLKDYVEQNIRTAYPPPEHSAFWVSLEKDSQYFSNVPVSHTLKVNYPKMLGDSYFSIKITGDRFNTENIKKDTSNIHLLVELTDYYKQFCEVVDAPSFKVKVGKLNKAIGEMNKIFDYFYNEKSLVAYLLKNCAEE